MRTKSQTAPTTQGQTSAPCPCGCAPCDNQCCDLECLVRPRFFCGQLLTDADLTALVEWSRARFRLTRYRHGWGVACGLEVSRDPKNPAGVLIHPGYAIDCCGNDIVICEPSRYSLANVCPQTECRDPRYDRRRALEQAQQRSNILLLRANGLAEEERKQIQAQVDALEAALKYEDLDKLLAAIKDLEMEGKKYDTGFDQPEYVSLLNKYMNNAQAVDLYLHYTEQGAEPQSALRRGACGAGECEDSRMHEGYRLRSQIVAGQDEPGSDWSDWKKRYEQRSAQAKVFFDRIKTAAEAGDIKSVCTALTSWLNDPEHAPGQFCFAHDRAKEICANAAKPDDTWRSDLIEVVFWLIMDDLSAWLACGCASCDPAEGIPLARVWLRGAQRGQPCRVVAIDNAPPRRRLLRRDDCLPAPDEPGCINLGSLIGQRWEDVKSELEAHGMHWLHITSQLAEWEDLRKLLEVYTRTISGCRGQTVGVEGIEHGGGWGWRVVGFSGAH